MKRLTTGCLWVTQTFNNMFNVRNSLSTTLFKCTVPAMLTTSCHKMSVDLIRNKEGPWTYFMVSKVMQFCYFMIIQHVYIPNVLIYSLCHYAFAFIRFHKQQTTLLQCSPFLFNPKNTINQQNSSQNSAARTLTKTEKREKASEYSEVPPLVACSFSYWF